MTEPSSATADTPTPLNILVVDDSAMMRTMIKRAAALTGLPIGQIFEAADGRQALEVLNAASTSTRSSPTSTCR